MSLIIRKRSNNGLKLVCFFFFILYCLVSLVNHYMFRTFALDLGMFNQAIYSYAHGQNAVFTLDPSGVETPFLATHFSPITFLYTPFYYLFGSYTLLIIQVCAIVAGGIGIYKTAANKLKISDQRIYLLLLIQFFCCWGIFSALSYDFHNNVIGAMLVPWLVYFYEQRKKIPILIFTLFILATQETMAMWLIFIFAGLIIEHYKKISLRNLLKFEVPLAVFCILYTFIVILVIMPVLQVKENNLQLTRYAHLGNSFGAMLKTLIMHPADTFRMFFTNTLNDHLYNGIKTELYTMVLVSGGIFLLLRPAYLVMLIPIFAQKMLSNDFGFWGINGQYSIELIPIISLAFIAFLSKMNKNTMTITIIVLCSTIFFTINALDHRTSKWYQPANNRFYSKDHFRAGINIKETNIALGKIPGNIPVASCSRLAPHIANREKLYHFPVIKDAVYIVLEKAGTYTYPLSKEDYLIQVDNYKQMPDWETFFENSDIIIFRKRTTVL